MKFKLAALSSYTDVAALSAAITEATAERDALFALDTPTPTDVEAATSLVAAIAELEAEKANREGAGDAMAALRAAAEGEPDGDTEDDNDDDDAEDGDDDENDSTDDAEDEDDEDGDADDADESGEAGDTAPDTTQEASAVNRTTAASKTRKPKTKSVALARKPVSMVASADIEGFGAGASLASMYEVGMAVASRQRSFAPPAGIEGGGMQKFSVASFRKDFGTGLVTNTSDDQALLEEAAKESNLPGKSLVAAGGWCAPSETIYDLCEGESTDGLIDVPELGIARGGLRYTPGPDFADIFANVGFAQTEAQAIAGTAKGCYEITCPTFQDVRLEAVGICIKVPILTEVGYPELVRRVMSGAMIAHQHKVSARVIGKMVTAAGTALTPADRGGSFANTLDSLELYAENLRQDYRLPLSTTMEVVLPFWVRSAMRADLGLRTGLDPKAVSDQMLTTHFADRKLRVQWVYNWQPLAAYEEGYPATVQALVYPAGTFVKGTADVINLSAVYDSAELNVNRYTGVFFEEGVLVAQRCYKAKLVTLNLCAAGETGAADGNKCFTLTP